MTVISLHQPRQELVAGGTPVGSRAAPFLPKTTQDGDTAAGCHGEIRTLAGGGGSGDACGLGAGRGTGGKFLVHGTLGLCILLRALQHPHLSPSVSQAWVL